MQSTLENSDTKRKSHKFPWAENEVDWDQMMQSTPKPHP